MAIVPQVHRQDDEGQPQRWKGEPYCEPNRVNAAEAPNENGDQDGAEVAEEQLPQLEEDLQVLMMHAANKRSQVEKATGYQAQSRQTSLSPHWKSHPSRMFQLCWLLL